MIPDFFVTGTGTDVGKTYVSQLLLNWVSSFIDEVIYYKPLATGCEKSDGTYCVPDEEAVLLYASDNMPQKSLKTHVGLSYEDPLAPYAIDRHLAESCNKDSLINQYKNMAFGEKKTVVVEGIGGVAVPLWEKYLVSDLIKDLALPVILVAQAHLGTINHTLLTLDHLKSKGINVLGFILNHSSKKKDMSDLTNAGIIQSFSQTPYLFTVEYGQLAFKESQSSTLKKVFSGDFFQNI
ncbi:dethiobiotin synthase [PVC group bacterium (ex Bugula neritina AB1)]|nr:dethiobiotin synthase [PVC group bacterium (ex Bugula neritina AB1)]